MMKKWKNSSYIVIRISLIDWFLAEDLSFHKIWFKSVNVPGRQANKQIDKQQFRVCYVSVYYARC